jgi:hypothetical protein
MIIITICLWLARFRYVGRTKISCANKKEALESSQALRRYEPHQDIYTLRCRFCLLVWAAFYALVECWGGDAAGKMIILFCAGGWVCSTVLEYLYCTVLEYSVALRTACSKCLPWYLSVAAVVLLVPCTVYVKVIIFPFFLVFGHFHSTWIFRRKKRLSTSSILQDNREKSTYSSTRSTRYKCTSKVRKHVQKLIRDLVFSRGREST